jgi:hypothetical protein
VSSSSPTTTQVLAQVASIHKRFPKGQVIGIRSTGGWQGAEKETIDEQSYQIVQCDSVLQIREALVSRDLSLLPLVVVTALGESELGDDVLARLAKHRLFTVHPWKMVLERFQARTAAPSLGSKKWLAEALLDGIPPAEYPAPASGVLDEETVWGIVLRRYFGFAITRPDAQDLLEWTLDKTNLARYQSARTELRQGAQLWIGQSAGPVADLIFRCIDGGGSGDVVPVGLACHVLFGTEAVTELREARVRLERFNSNKPLVETTARDWTAAVERLIAKLDSQGQHREALALLERSDHLLRELHVEGFSYLSRLSPSGFELRLNRFGKCLNAALEKAPLELPDELASLAEDVFAHRQSAFERERADRVAMSLRLLHWLIGHKEDVATSFENAARSYINDGGFVDWARYYLFAGENVDSLAKAYSLLYQAVAVRRELQNKRFGELLANWTEVGSASDGVIPIEDVLQNVVAKVAQNERVLLIVLDGMSWAALRELLADAVSKGWIEMGPDRKEWPPAIISGIPSVTQVSRTSLLCGKLTTGLSAVELAGFQANAELLKVSQTGRWPVLFHKAGLTEATASILSSAVREEIASDKRQIVGVVVNAIDDHLAKGSQIAVPWTLRHVPVLDQLFFAARDAGRVLILTSDHGHILERESSYRESDSGERYRIDDGKPMEGELVVRGPRVMLPPGGSLIAPWCEYVRYAAKKHGYHGGISPQECLVPLVVLSRLNQPMKGWDALPSYYPEWWERSGKVGPATRLPAVRVETQTDGIGNDGVVGRPSGPSLDETRPLFALVGKSVTPARDHWIETLLQSGTFVTQVGLAGRAAPTAELVRAFLGAIDERGGKILKGALAQRLGQPELRVNGIISAMRRLLNVDGYGVLSVDDASETIALNVELLKVQFDLKD